MVKRKKPRNFHAMNACLRQAGPMKSGKRKRDKTVNWEDEYYTKDECAMEGDEWKDLLDHVKVLVELEKFLDE